MICQKYGVVPAGHHCRKFRYDPLKRVPSRPNVKRFDQLDDKDYSL